MTTVLLYSGGLDSAAATLLWRPDLLLYVDVGSAYARVERSRLPARTIVVEMPMKQWERPDGIIPCRNLMFAIVASNYGDRIALGATRGDRVLDKSVEFAERTSALMSFLWSPQHWTTGREIRLELPLKQWTKREIIAEYVRAGGDACRLASESYSCYRGEATECMACKACMRKWVAFMWNGIALPRSAEPYIRAKVLPAIRAGQSGRGDEDDDILVAIGEGPCRTSS